MKQQQSHILPGIQFEYLEQQTDFDDPISTTNLHALKKTSFASFTCRSFKQRIMKFFSHFPITFDAILKSHEINQSRLFTDK